MPSLPHSKHAPVLTPSKFRHLLRVTGATSQQPERNVFILWLTHTTGIRVTELGQLTISDVMFPSGKLRNEIYLRSAITKHSKPRVIYLTHPKAIESLEQWLLYRIKRQWECRPIKEYRGIWPESTLLLSHKGRAFELTRKPRLLESGIEETYWCCDALQQSISRLYRKAFRSKNSS